MTDIHSDKAQVPERDTAGSRLAAKRAAKAARKAATRGTANAVEDVAKSVSGIGTWLALHARTVWLAVGAIVALGVIVIGASSFFARGNREGGSLLHSAVMSSHGLVVTPEETQPEDVIVPVFPTATARNEKALAQYRDVLKKAPGGLAGHYAALGEANTLLDLGKAPEAGAEFEKLRTALGAPSERPGDAESFLHFRTLEGAGYALEAQHKYAEARQRFEALSKLYKGAYRVLGDYHRARMLVAEGQRDEAKKLLEALTKAAADKPVDANEPTDSFEAAETAAQTLLVELGGQPAERSSGASSGISQQVLDSLRKQLGNAKK